MIFAWVCYLLFVIDENEHFSDWGKQNKDLTKNVQMLIFNTAYAIKIYSE